MSNIVSFIKISSVSLLLILGLCINFSAAAEERAVLTSQEEALWRDQGFSPTDAGEWKYYGVSPKDARKWIDVGIQFPGWANQWIGEGFSPEEAAKWKDLTNVYTAGKFMRYGFSASEAKVWMDQGVQSALRAKEYKEFGMSAEEGGSFWKLGLYPEEVKSWHDAGFSPREMIDWHFGPKDVAYFHTKESPYSRQVYSVEWAMPWKVKGFSPKEAQKAVGFGIEFDEAVRWKEAGFSFDEMVDWLDSGFDIPGALERKGAGFGAVEAERARYKASEKSGDEISDIHYYIDLKKDGKVDVYINLEMINRPDGEYTDKFYFPVSDNVTLRYRESHSREARPTNRIRYAEVDGARTGYYVRDGLLHIGDKGSPLANGRHRISFSYTTDDRIVTFADHDELYFSLTEDIRELRIDRASASVRLPEGAQIIFADGYAGFDGRKDFAVRVRETESGDVAEYEVTRPLRKDMKFVLSVAFLKGHVDLGPLHEVRRVDRQEGHIFTSFAIFISGFLILTIYYYLVWRRVGRDSRRSTVLSVSAPPDDLGPAEMRQLYTRGKVDDISTAATILMLAETGGLTISEKEGAYRIERGLSGGGSVLEKGFLERIFSGNEELIMGHAHTRKATVEALHFIKAELKKEFKGLQHADGRYIWAGLAMSLIILLSSFAVLDLNDFGKEKFFKNVYLCLMIGLLGGVNLIFKWLLKAPTEAYAERLDRIEGYRIFLEMSFKKEARQKGSIPPFLQRHLPYAVALGINCRGITIRDAGWFTGGTSSFSVGEFLSSVFKKSRG